MFRWLNGPGAAFRHPLPGSTNYLNAYDRNGRLVRAKDRTPGRLNREKEENKDEEEEEDKEADETDEDGNILPTRTKKIQEARVKDTKDEPPLPKESGEDLIPFPMNRQFRSQPVLSEDCKDEIYKRIVENGSSVRNVSAVLGVEMNRVAAVVRLKAVEKKWEKEGKPIAFSYAKAVLAMLPTTPYVERDPIPHESINDLPVHRATETQIFHPVSESRHFTRRDAGKVFDSQLKPAEDRVPHTELVQLEKWRFEGKIQVERLEMQSKKDAQEIGSKKFLEAKMKEREAREIRRVETERSEFRFQDIRVESAGPTGRSQKGVGVRYGMPHEDRKKGQIKIPRRVEW